jgi:uncharacterized protein
MSIINLAGFLVLAGAAAYAQTLTGFAFGLITMGGVGLLGLMSLPDAAVIVSVLTLVNALQMLLKGWRDVAWRQFGLVMLSSAPLLFVGYGLLGRIASAHADFLRLALGFVICVSSLQLAMKTEPSARLASDGSFVFFGGVAGLMGGLFSTAGPPLVYHFYRQPLPPIKVRETLVTIFALNAILRLAIVTGSADLPPPSTWPCLFAIPVVMATTYAARRWPPPLSPRVLRRIVFFLLFSSGVSLALPGVLHLAGMTEG